MGRVRRLPEPLRLLAVAVGFLTRVPVGGAEVGASDLRRASALFPLVGAGVAGIGVAARAALEPVWGPAVATVAAVAAMIAVTGALHEDGLADTADGLWGGWDPAARLAIMRDSRIGTYGTVALVTALGLRTSLLLPLGLADFARAVACGHVLGRASTLLLVRLLPVAGTGAGAGTGTGAPDGSGSLAEPGVQPGAQPAQPGTQARRAGRPRLGAAVAGPLSGRATVAAAAVAAVTVAVTVGVAARAWAPVPLAAGLLACLACARLLRRRLGGVTGDTLGAATVAVDLAAVAAVAALARAGLL